LIFSRNESGFPLISLSGYTGAGKSSLFNALAHGRALVTGRPFTTLSTKTLAVELDGKRALLSDTVGFIDNLPLTLVEAFRSTLQETINADLILLVVDCSEDTDSVTRKLDCCRRTLREIGVVNKPMITVLNKLDLTSEETVKKLQTHLEDTALNPVAISALHGTNMSSLRETIAGELRNFVRASFELPLEPSTMSLISKIRSQSTVLNERFQEKTVHLRVQSVDYLMEKIRNWIEQVGGRLLESTRV
ncbi:MAG: GTPase, partial [Candidatus Bathyarchaeia archaeon]